MKDRKDKSEIEEIGCLEAIDGLYAYIDGEMDDPETLAKFEHHLEHCRSCYTRREMEAAISKRIRKVGKGDVPEKLQGRLRALIDRL